MRFQVQMDAYLNIFLPKKKQENNARFINILILSIY